MFLTPKLQRFGVAVDLSSRDEWFKFWPKQWLIWRTFLVISGNISMKIQVRSSKPATQPPSSPGLLYP